MSADLDLRAHVEAVWREKDRALDMASEEREKAAAAARGALELRTAEGDARLRDHIDNQFQQVHAALESAEKLEVERVARVAERVSANTGRLEAIWEIYQKDSVALRANLEARFELTQHAAQEHMADLRRELEAASASQKEAVGKAEIATAKQFESANEWRGQSADRERSQQEAMAALSSTFLPREVADTQFAELRKLTALNTDRINSSLGEKRGASEFHTRMLAAVVALAGVAAVISPHIH